MDLFKFILGNLNELGSYGKFFRGNYIWIDIESLGKC